MKKPVVLYHRDCDDGFGAAYAFWVKYHNAFEYIGVKHGEPLSPELYTERDVYIVDFSYPPDILRTIREYSTKVVLLDHHLTAFEMYCPDGERDSFHEIHTYKDPVSRVKYEMYLTNNSSGATLAWEYVHGDDAPELIRYIEDSDLWRYEFPDTLEVIFALRSYPQDFVVWNDFHHSVDKLREEGKVLVRYFNQQKASVLKNGKRKIIINGVEGLGCNASYLFGSYIGNDLAKESGTFGLSYFIADDGMCHCSLRSEGNFNVAAMAQSFGGGGHLNAAGFRIHPEKLHKMFI